jgi:hypothetical protein
VQVVAVVHLAASSRGESRTRVTVTGAGAVTASAHGAARTQAAVTGTGQITASARGESRTRAAVVDPAFVGAITASSVGSARAVARVGNQYDGRIIRLAELALGLPHLTGVLIQIPQGTGWTLTLPHLTDIDLDPGA